jgi:uncharacterized membrane protein YgdD (TMEM256/DUF423 family)
MNLRPPQTQENFKMTATKPTLSSSDRLLAFVGGLYGAAGVALSAMAAHRGGAFTGTAANFLLFHASALLAMGLIGQNRWLRLGGFILAVGLAVFCGDLVSRDLLGNRLFPFAAPVGGTLLIAGWLLVAVSALIRPKV